MRIVIAGGHGQIALRLERLLAGRGDEVAGIIRRPEQAGDLLAAGAEPVVCDLESASVQDVARHMEGADAAVFAAGAGPGSGIERKDSVDRGATALFADAAEAAGVRRFLVVSSMGADREIPEGTDPVFAAYLRAKGAADADVRARAGLDWTILRPGRLTDDPGTGRVTLADATGRDAVPRDDVAATLMALLDEPATIGRTLELIGGDVPVVDAVRAVSAAQRG
ncbi:NAD(P)H-binding protein [Streptomyces sp. NPDC048434]|uniref:NAD(P)H-binding protein n=1 Tax=Streptomyces sp. NPDC048434 TaxID=3365549 RepID=UPI00371EB96E